MNPKDLVGHTFVIDRQIWIVIPDPRGGICVKKVTGQPDIMWQHSEETSQNSLGDVQTTLHFRNNWLCGLDVYCRNGVVEYAYEYDVEHNGGSWV